MTAAQWGLVLLPAVGMLVGLITGWIAGRDEARRELAPWEDAIAPRLKEAGLYAPGQKMKPDELVRLLLAEHRRLASREAAIETRDSVNVHYTVLYDYAYENCLDYNDLCKMLRKAVGKERMP